MAKASEDQLAELHAALAKAYRQQIESGEVNPALLTSAANFLKHNNISCDPENSEDLKKLQEKTKEKMSFPFDPEEVNNGISH